MLRRRMVGRRSADADDHVRICSPRRPRRSCCRKRRREVLPSGAGLVEVPVHEPAVIADRGNQWRPWRAEQIERNRLFDAGTHDAPFGRLAGIESGQIESLVTAVAGDEHGVVGIGRIDSTSNSQ